jgi:hypothetical protein
MENLKEDLEKINLFFVVVILIVAALLYLPCLLLPSERLKVRKHQERINLADKNWS